jgi:O-acetyl-ADP-ribose deacetylase (regulator of RNase III)
VINFINGNILNAKENIICQQVNCQGIMGAGLAKQIMDRWPKVYSEYIRYCYSEKIILNTALFVLVDRDLIVANLFSQDDYGRSNKVYTNYLALESALTKVKIYGMRNKYSIAIPYGIGCGLANGDWKIVSDIIERVFEDYDAVIYKLQ